MKQIVLCMIALTLYSCSIAQLKTPQASPTQTIKQDFGTSAIELTYSRPAKRGRVVMGDLVPYGKVWRTGANQATTITFGDEVTIGGKKIPAGKYGLLTIPAKDNWTVIITKQLDVSSPDAYKPESDLARVTVKPVALNNLVENFTIQFDKIMPTACDIQMMWEKTAISIPVRTDIDAKIMAQIDSAMVGEKPPYFAAAGYYFDNGKDLAKARTWAEKAVTADSSAFYIVHLLAKIQAKQGDKSAAIATAKKSIELSKVANNTDYVKLNEKLIATLK